jgi:plastocyanin
MVKKEERRLEEHINIHDSVSVKVTRRVIIPPKFTNPDLKVNYFMPRFKKVIRGEDVEWVNEDNTNHHLEFYDLSGDKFESLFDSGVIEQNKSFKRQFDFDQTRIDYICKFHDNEVGAVIIYQKPEDQMTNTERLQFLSETFKIEPPSILSHLGH